MALETPLDCNYLPRWLSLINQKAKSKYWLSHTAQTFIKGYDHTSSDTDCAVLSQRVWQQQLMAG